MQTLVRGTCGAVFLRDGIPHGAAPECVINASCTHVNVGLAATLPTRSAISRSRAAIEVLSRLAAYVYRGLRDPDRLTTVDLFSRRIVGWQLAADMPTDLPQSFEIYSPDRARRRPARLRRRDRPIPRVNRAPA